MKFYYLTDAEINKLKTGLMSKKFRKNRKYKSYSSSQIKSHSSSISKSFSSFCKQSVKTNNDNIFNENIKNLLKIEYGWTDVINDTHFIYRIIQIGARKILLKLGYSKKLIINGRRYKFVLYQNQSISIFTGYISRRFITNISQKTQGATIALNNTKILISKVNEIEIDGFLKLTSNTIDKIINDSDIICLYKNINNDKIKNFQYACCEIKLSMDQINKLIKQLEKDQNVLENIIGYKKIIYIGFVGNDKKNNKISNNSLVKLKKINNLNFLILQIKNCTWLKRNLTQYIDWKTYSILKDKIVENALLHEKIDELVNKNTLLKEKVDVLKEFVNNALGIKSGE